jgi:hypothetical protein
MSTVDFSTLPKPNLDDHPEFIAIYDKAWQLAATHIKRHQKGYDFMDVAWADPKHLYEWVWDSCFIALYCRYAPRQYPGMQSLDNFYNLQREDGYISMTYDVATGEEPYPDRINPPLFAWVEWEYYLTTGDSSRFARVIPHIERLMDWIDKNRRPAKWWKAEFFPLYCFEDCGSSGMDDSPRTPRHRDAGRFFEWIDLSAQMALSFRCLARMYAALGNAHRLGHAPDGSFLGQEWPRSRSAVHSRPPEAGDACAPSDAAADSEANAGDRSSYWEARAAALGNAINERLWCDRTQFYHDRNLSQRWIATKSAAAFWPLLAGICDDPRKDALVVHLMDEHEFNTPTPVPSLSADDLNYSPQGEYWIGGVWPPINYMVARGLMTAGRGDAAHHVAVKYLGALARTYKTFDPHTLWECQSPSEDKPGLTPYERKWVKPDFVGWSGIGPIAMLIENVLGIDVRAPERRIEWTIRLTERHGIENLDCGEMGKVSLMCEARKSADAPAKVEALCEKPAELLLCCASRRVAVKLGAGRTVDAVV